MANIEDFYESKKGSPLPDELRVTKPEREKMPEPEKSGSSTTLLFIVILIAIAALGLAGFFYWKYTNMQKNIETQKNACQESINQAQETIANIKVEEDTEKEKQKVTEEIVKVRLAVYNGTNIAGLAKSLGEKAAEISGVEISTTTNAKKNYTKNIVVNLGKVDSEIAQKIADKIDGEVGDMPDGETKPEADILVIGGKSIK